MEDTFFKLITIFTALLFGFDYFFVSVFNKGLIFVPVVSKQITMKFVLSALLITSITFRIFILMFVILSIAFSLLNSINLELLVWLSLFIQIFYHIYFVGYLFPKVRRIIYWDYKNPISKWESLYQNYLKASNYLLAVSIITLILTVTAFFLYKI